MISVGIGGLVVVAADMQLVLFVRGQIRDRSAAQNRGGVPRLDIVY